MMKEFKDIRQYQAIWENNGFDLTEPEASPMEVKDALATSNAAMWLPKVISNIVKEAAEPLLIGTSLLERINFKYGQTITFPAVGALVAADIAEGQAYPERQLQMGGATVTASIGKSGVAVKITEEMIRYSQFDVIGMHLRAAGRALARHKEQKIFNYIKSMGVVTHDNRIPGASLFGTTTGRGLSGAANGSVTMDDLFDALGQVIMQGFTPNTLLMHPLTWVMFVKDPILRAFALSSGGGTFFATASGNPAGRAPWDTSSQGKLGAATGQEIVPGGAQSGEAASGLEAYSQTITSAPKLPNYFPFPMRIIVSPFVPYNPKDKLTDIIMFDSMELGALIVDEDVTVDEWNDQSVDIRKIKLRERYGIGIFNEGQAIAVLRNVKVVPNEIVLPAQADISVSGSIADINRGTSIV
jgi:hypothetical protein